MNYLGNIFRNIIQPTMFYNSQLLPSNNGFSLIPSRGFKVFGKVRKRCKDCYFITRDQRVYNLCKAYPKHKQMSIRHTDKAYYILTGVQQKKVREW